MLSAVIYRGIRKADLRNCEILVMGTHRGHSRDDLAEVHGVAIAMDSPGVGMVHHIVRCMHGLPRSTHQTSPSQWTTDRVLPLRRDGGRTGRSGGQLIRTARPACTFRIAHGHRVTLIFGAWVMVGERREKQSLRSDRSTAASARRQRHRVRRPRMISARWWKVTSACYETSMA